MAIRWSVLSCRSMLFALGKGLLFGMVMSMMLGTVFFALIQNSIQNGWNKGVMIAAGVVFSDMIFISLAIFGVSFITPDEHNMWIEVAAVVLLLFLGVNSIMNRTPKIVYPDTKFGKALYYFGNGFLLNGLNPVNFLFWAGLAVTARTEWQYDTPTLMVFFAGCLCSIFLSEVGISFGAHKIKRFLNENILIWINRITGSVFILAALYLIGQWIGWSQQLLELFSA